MEFSDLFYLVLLAIAGSLVAVGLHFFLGERVRNYTAVKCGHQSKKSGMVYIFGRKCFAKIPKNKDGTVDYCLDCLAEMTILCPWCGGSIFIDDPVTLYTPKDPNYKPSWGNYAVYSQEPLRMVGCLHCSPEASFDRAGFWVPPGEVKRVLSPTEECIASNDGVSITGNVFDPCEAIPFEE